MRTVFALACLVCATPAFAAYNEPVPNAPDCQGPGQHWAYVVATGTLSCVTSLSPAQQMSRGAAANFYAIAGRRSPRDQMMHR